MNNFSNINSHIAKERLNVYLGSEKKKTLVMDDGQQYMLKLPDPSRKHRLELSYINNALSEYIGCHVYHAIGIPVQDTYLGIYTTEKGKSKISCLCKDFANDGIILHEAEKLELSSDGTFANSELLTFDLIREIIDNTILSKEQADDVWNKYCDRTIVDALIGNTDRHNGNWGLAEYSDGTIQIAPVFDCGSSFSPLLEDDEMTERSARREALATLSALKDGQTGKRLSFAQIINSGNLDVRSALKRIVPLINLTDINNIVNEIPYISNRRKNFYNSLVNIRYSDLMIPALEKSLRIEKSNEYKQWNSRIIGSIFSIYIEPLQNLPDNSIENIQINGKIYSVRKNNDYIFLVNRDKTCIGVFSVIKSNQNVEKFVQCMRNLNNAIDIEALKHRNNVVVDRQGTNENIDGTIAENTAYENEEDEEECDDACYVPELGDDGFDLADDD